MHRQAMLRATWYPAGDGYARGYYSAGGFGSFLKKAVSASTKVAAGFASGGIAGAALATAGLLKGGPAAQVKPNALGMPQSNLQLMTNLMPAGSKKQMLTTGANPFATTAALTRGEQAGKRPRAINPRTGKPYRHMNPFNFKALRRADRRMHRFAKAVRHFVTVTRTGHAGVKVKHRRRSR